MKLLSSLFNKNFVNVIIVAALGLLSWLVYNRINEYDKQQKQLIETQQQLLQTNAEQKETIEQIVRQNQLTLEHVQTVQRNMTTINQLRSTLRTLNETVTPDVDPTIYENQLNLILQNQYQCLDLVTTGETNVPC